MFSTPFRGNDPALPASVGAERVPADWQDIPEEWKRSVLFQDIDNLRGVSESIDFVKALRWYCRHTLDTPIQVREQETPNDAASGELRICRLERRGREYALVVYSDFIRMWNDLVANDVWFRYNFPQDGQRRVVSVALGVLVRTAKHETARFPLKGKPADSLTETLRQHREPTGQIPERDADRNEIATVWETGRYAVVNDAIWMWFLGSYCFRDTTRYNNNTLRDRLHWFFDGEEAGEVGLHREFPSLTNDEARRAHAIGISLFINQCYYGGGMDPFGSLEGLFTSVLLQTKAENLWRNPDTSSVLWKAVGYCQIRVLWRTFLQPELSREEQQASFNRELATLVSRHIARIMSLDERIAEQLSATLLTQISEEVSVDFLLGLLAQGEHRDFQEVMQGLLRACDAFAARATVSGDSRERGVLTGMIAAVSDFRCRIIKLEPELVSSLDLVTTECLEWLKRHPDVLDTIAADAFEKIVAEILASQGFEVDITAKVRGASADIMAVRRDAAGKDVRYLVECKRYSTERKRRIGIQIVHEVLGALVHARARQRVDQALLVTTTSFTRDVKQDEPVLRSLDLELRSGADVKQWLSEYELREDYGLWLSKEGGPL